MKARIAIQIGVTPKEWRLLKQAAKDRYLPLASYVREAALLTAEENPQLLRREKVAS